MRMSETLPKQFHADDMDLETCLLRLRLAVLKFHNPIFSLAASTPGYLYNDQ